MFGNIVKVTPSSKVVGDMALFMTSNDLTPEDVLERGEDLAYPESVKSFFPRRPRATLSRLPGEAAENNFTRRNSLHG